MTGRRLQAVEKYPWPEGYRAPCVGHDDLFFAPDSGDTRRQRAETRDQKQERESLAKALCHVCEARLSCLEAAVMRSEPVGIWGGLTQEERGFPTSSNSTSRSPSLRRRLELRQQLDEGRLGA